MDALLAELFRGPADPPVRPDGPTARILRDLWLGGMPLSRAATAAGLTTKAAEETLRHLGLPPAEPGRRLAREDRQHPAPAQPAPKRPRRNWSALRTDMVRLYEEATRSAPSPRSSVCTNARCGASSWRPASPAGPAASAGCAVPLGVGRSLRR